MLHYMIMIAGKISLDVKSKEKNDHLMKGVSEDEPASPELLPESSSSMYKCLTNGVIRGKSRCTPYPYRSWMPECGAAATSADLSKALKALAAGTITGVLDVLITYPIDFVKTQLQLDQSTGIKKYNGMVDCFRKTIKNYGALGMYRGIPIILFATAPKDAIRFGTYEAIKSHILSGTRAQLSTSEKVFCGLTSGVAEAVLVVTPMETLKIKYITDLRLSQPRFSSFFQCLKITYKEEGFQGVYQGVAPTVLRQGTNQAVRFSMVDTLRESYTGGNPAIRVPMPTMALYGSIAGTMSVLINNPVDVVKTRMQAISSLKCESMRHCFATIYKEGGYLAFYKGAVPRLYRVGFDSGLSFMMYDFVLGVLTDVFF